MNIYQQIIREAINASGMTFKPSSLTFGCKSGILVSIKGKEVQNKDLSEVLIKKYIADNEELFNKGFYFGLWFENNLWYYDVSINLSCLHVAKKFAEDNEQLAIYDCENKSVLFLNDKN